MFCSNCGTPLREGQKFCENCGAPVTSAQASQQTASQAQQTEYDHSGTQGGNSQTAPPAFDPDTSEVGILGCGFALAVRRYFEKYLTFHGRATRSEYWWVVLMEWAIFIIANWLSKILPGADMIVALALFCPSLSLLVRREHDIGRSGTRVLAFLIPLVGWIMLLVDMLTRSAGSNRFGPAPISLD